MRFRGFRCYSAVLTVSVVALRVDSSGHEVTLGDVKLAPMWHLKEGVKWRS